MILYKFENQANFRDILISSDEYDKDSGCIFLHVPSYAPNARVDTNEDFVTSLAAALFNDTDIEYVIHKDVKFKIEPPTYSYHIRIKDIDKLRQVVDCLFRKGAISAADRADIEKHILEVELQQKCKNLLVSTTNEGQNDTLEMLVSPYVDSVIEEIADPCLALKVLFMAFSVHAHTYSNDTVYSGHWWGLESKTLNIVNDFNRLEYNKLNTVKDCLYNLAIFYNDNNKITDTLVRLGGSLPDLKAQRSTIIKYIMKGILSKRPKEHSFVAKIKQSLAELKEKTDNPVVLCFKDTQFIIALMLGELEIYEQELNAHPSQVENNQAPISLPTIVQQEPEENEYDEFLKASEEIRRTFTMNYEAYKKSQSEVNEAKSKVENIEMNQRSRSPSPPN